MSVFFTATATSEIYTYVLLLSLPDALPISRIRRRLRELFRVRRDELPSGLDVVLIPRSTAASVEHASLQRSYADLAQALKRRFRSEEHTSELQSLMRISYAVFFLKKTSISQVTTNI